MNALCRETKMTEKIEWEVVDEPATNRRYKYRDTNRLNQDRIHAARKAAITMLGPWWKWKLAGIAAVAVVVFAFVATVVSVLALSVVGLAIALALVRKFILWLRHSDASSSVVKL